LLSGVFFLQNGCGLQADESPVAFQPAGKSESGEAVVFNAEFLLADPAPQRGAGRGLIAALALR